MATEMTPQEGAAAWIYNHLSAGGEFRDMDNDLRIITLGIQQVRRAALLEAREVVLAEVLEDIPDNEADEAYNLAIGHAAHALDRLAQEG